MCEVSKSLKLCTCDVESVTELEHYWVFHRLIPGKNRMVIGRVRLLDEISPIVDASNRATLLARLNEADVFDVDLGPREGDRLLLTFRCSENGRPKTLHYGYGYTSGKWVEEPYSALGWEWHHDEESFGQVRPALSVDVTAMP